MVVLAGMKQGPEGLKHAEVGLCISQNWKYGICYVWMISFNATYYAERCWLRQVRSANYTVKECCNANRRKQACDTSQICCYWLVLAQDYFFWYSATLASCTCDDSDFLPCFANIIQNKKKNLSN